MFKTLLRFTKRPAPELSGDGFVWVGDEEDGPMRAASKGCVIRIAGRGPPWIVVNHEATSVIAAKWPGKLWHVRIVDAATLNDQRERGGPPRASAGYTRAVAVEVLGEADAGTMFGPQGSEVLRVIDAAAHLDRHQAVALALHRNGNAANAQDRAWRAWMNQKQIPNKYYPDLLDGTLLLGTWGSPINGGLSKLYDVTFKRAKALDGDAAIETNEEDVWLAQPWNDAFSALADAALGMAAPSLASSEDREILLQAWLSVYG